MTVKKNSKINLYKFVNAKSTASSSDSPEVQKIAEGMSQTTSAMNNLGLVVNGIAKVVTDLKKIQYSKLNAEQKKRLKAFKPSYGDPKVKPFKKMLLAVKTFKVKGFLESLLGLFGGLFKWFVIRPALKWLSDPKNQKAIQKTVEVLHKIFKVLTKFAKWTVGGALDGLYEMLKDDATWWERLKGFASVMIRFAAVWGAMTGIGFLLNPVKTLQAFSGVLRMFNTNLKRSHKTLLKRKGRLAGFGRKLGGVTLSATVLWGMMEGLFPNAAADGTLDAQMDESGKLPGDKGYDEGTAGSNKNTDKEKTTSNNTDKGEAVSWWKKLFQRDKKKDDVDIVGKITGITDAKVLADKTRDSFKQTEEDAKSSLFSGFDKIFGGKLTKASDTFKDALGGMDKVTNTISSITDSSDKKKGGNWFTNLFKLKERESGGLIQGPNSGYPVAMSKGGPTSFIGHGTEYIARKPGSNDGYVIPLSNAATAKDGSLTSRKMKDARSKGFALPGFDTGGLFTPSRKGRDGILGGNTPGGIMGSNQQKWSKILKMARQSGAKYPELVAAQFALESAWGTKLSAKNNYFGMKATASQDGVVTPTTEFFNGQEVKGSAKFRNFNSPKESIDNLVNLWYKDYKGFKGVNNAGSAGEAAKMLMSEGYATDPAYAKSLMGLMNQYQTGKITGAKGGVMMDMLRGKGGGGMGGIFGGDKGSIMKEGILEKVSSMFGGKGPGGLKKPGLGGMSNIFAAFGGGSTGGKGVGAKAKVNQDKNKKKKMNAQQKEKERSLQKVMRERSEARELLNSKGVEIMQKAVLAVEESNAKNRAFIQGTMKATTDVYRAQSSGGNASVRSSANIFKTAVSIMNSFNNPLRR
tara:strand:- start:6667 stop:9246 length:2580 start_codon:yes stop_codon:yes gene_type:complete